MEQLVNRILIKANSTILFDLKTNKQYNNKQREKETVWPYYMCGFRVLNLTDLSCPWFLMMVVCIRVLMLMPHNVATSAPLFWVVIFVSKGLISFWLFLNRNITLLKTEPIFKPRTCFYLFLRCRNVANILLSILNQRVLVFTPVFSCLFCVWCYAGSFICYHFVVW